MDSTTYNHETVVRSKLPLLVVVVYLPRIQILVGQSWAGTTLKGWPLGLSGRGSGIPPLPTHNTRLQDS
jgi:hypothetical protein